MSGESVQAMENRVRVFTPGERKQRASSPLPLRAGVHLFIDDSLIERSENLTRCVNVPQRDPTIPNLIVTGKEDGCFQPYFTVLRDDLKADNTPDPPDAYGIGYPTLAWTRDGETCGRDRETFFDRRPTKGTWDHAHAWIDEQVLVGDDVYLYYGGYARGHKVERFTERQIGLVRMKRDHYVSRDAGDTQGVLRTPLVTLDASRMTVNARVVGTLRVRLLDADGKPVHGFDWTDSAPIRGDAIIHPVGWKTSLASLRGKPVRIEFALRHGQLFAFELT